jgi:hypothetical protein
LKLKPNKMKNLMFLFLILTSLALASCTKEEYTKMVCTQSILATTPDGDTLQYDPAIPYEFDLPMSTKETTQWIKEHTYSGSRECGAYYVVSKAQCGEAVCGDN